MDIAEGPGFEPDLERPQMEALERDWLSDDAQFLALGIEAKGAEFLLRLFEFEVDLPQRRSLGTSLVDRATDLFRLVGDVAEGPLDLAEEPGGGPVPAALAGEAQPAAGRPQVVYGLQKMVDALFEMIEPRVLHGVQVFVNGPGDPGEVSV